MKFRLLLMLSMFGWLRGYLPYFTFVNQSGVNYCEFEYFDSQGKLVKAFATTGERVDKQKLYPYESLPMNPSTQRPFIGIRNISCPAGTEPNNTSFTNKEFLLGPRGETRIYFNSR